MPYYFSVYHSRKEPGSLEERADRRHLPGIGSMTSLLILTVLLAASSSLAAPQLTEVTPEVRAQVIEDIAELLEALYVIPETATDVQRMLRANLATGHYGGTHA
jgi:hypothetical protein